MGCPPVKSQLSFDRFGAMDVLNLKAQACKSKDDHVIKLIYTCIEEYDHYGNEGYLHIAASLFK